MRSRFGTVDAVPEFQEVQRLDFTGRDLMFRIGPHQFPRRKDFFRQGH